MLDELKEVKCFKKNNRFQVSYNVKYFKEIKRLKSLQKAENFRTQASIFDGAFLRIYSTAYFIIDVRLGNT